MYAGDGASMLVAPLYDHPTNHCIRFRFHMRMRGGNAGALRLFAQETDDASATIPPRAITAHSVRYFIEQSVTHPAATFVIVAVTQAI